MDGVSRRAPSGMTARTTARDPAHPSRSSGGVCGWLSSPRGMLVGPSSAPSPRTLSVLAGEEVGAVSKPRGRHVKVREDKDKDTARKVSAVLISIARLVRAVGVLADALGRWFG